MSTEEPSYLAFAKANVRDGLPSSATIVKPLLDRIRTLEATVSKPTILGYVVVDRDGRRVPGASYTNRETAQAYADRWSNDAKANRLDLDYRVAEIVEVTR